MGIKHIEAGRKGGLPRWFSYLTEGTPGLLLKENLSQLNHSQTFPMSNAAARVSLSRIIPK